MTEPLTVATSSGRRPMTKDEEAETRRQWAEHEAGRPARDMMALRRERDRRLAACDWTQVADAALTPEKIAQWRNYRQALRDLPARTLEPGRPAWPTEPEK